MSRHGDGFAASGSEERPEDIEFDLSKVSDEELVGVLTGGGFWWNHGVKSLDLPPLWMSDGPHGVRGFYMYKYGEDTSLAFPCLSALASTFDTNLIHKVGELLAAECHRIGNHILLAPTINLHRMPHTGRHFEC